MCKVYTHHIHIYMYIYTAKIQKNIYQLLALNKNYKNNSLNKNSCLVQSDAP